MPFLWFKNLGNVIPVRRFRHTTRFPVRSVSDAVQLSLPLVQAVAGAIPLVGPPMQVVISGLLMILQTIDTRGQNMADLDRLTQRLHRLSYHISNAPTAQDYPEQCRRDSLVRILQETSTQLTNLRKRSLAYRSVTQAIAGCSSEINNYLLESLWSSQMQSHNQVLAIQRQQEQVLMKIESLRIRDQSSMGSTATQLTATVTGCVTVIDATGYEYPIPVDFCTSYQQLNDMLQVLFKRDTAEARIQRRYLEKGRYDLCIDEGTRVARLTSHQWSTIEAGTTIVMRVVFKQQDISSYEVDYKCHFCGAINRLPTGSITYSLKRQAGCSIDCRACKRRFEISRREYNDSAEQSTRSSDIDSNDTTDAEMRLIRNFHVEQTSEFLLMASMFDEAERQAQREMREVRDVVF